MNTDNLNRRWVDTSHRGIDFKFTWEYRRDMFSIHKLDVTRQMKECIDLYIDHGITNKVIYSHDKLHAPDMFMEWEVHGDKLITRMSRL
jgi:hypothetical protein